MQYIISEDISLLLGSWARENGFLVPIALIKLLRQEMHAELERIFGNKVEVITEEALSQGLVEICRTTDLPIVSLDKSYLQHEWRLDINRAVDLELNDLGEKERFGCQPLDEQIARLKEAGLCHIALLDDVVFSGNGIVRLSNQLRQSGIEVALIIAGIVIGEGAERITNNEINILAVRHYAEVIDEICERDFYPGVPFSGRSIYNQSRNVGAPYLRPFGKPEEWASIPASESDGFSNFCLRQTIALWRGIEKVSDRPVKCSDISRLPIGAPDDGSRFVDFLGSLL
jgi:hypothetical protein